MAKESLMWVNPPPMKYLEKVLEYLQDNTISVGDVLGMVIDGKTHYYKIAYSDRNVFGIEKV